jgi:hypothetical protein
MANYLIGRLCLVAATGALTLGAATPAEGAVTVGDCTITALRPTPVVLNEAGTKVAAGRASARCATNRELGFDLVLYGEDPLRDDLVDRAVAFRKVGSTTQTVEQLGLTTGLLNTTNDCNEDIGADELYSKVRARILTGYNEQTQAVWGAWSAWTRGPTVTYTC